MKKSVSMYGRVTPQKKTEAKPASRPAQKSSAAQGNGVGSITPSAAAKDRRSPVVTDQTIATNSVIQAANDPKIKELVIKQQMMDRKQRESMEKKRPRGDLLTGAFLSLEHSGGFASSGHHPSHSGQFFYKHSSFDEASPAAGDHHYEGDRGFVRYAPSSPDVHHHPPYAQPTPGSHTETVVQADSGLTQQDDVNSELTADAGYMSIQKGPVAPVTRMEGIPSAGVSPHNGMMASSPSMSMHMYMDLNASLLHEPHLAASYPGAKLSPHHAGAYGSHLPPPPPLTLPQAMHVPVASGGQVPSRVHSAYEAATGVSSSIPAASLAHSESHSVAPSLPDPKELDDSALQAAYYKFLLEMETRGLHSMSLNGPSAAAAERTVPVSISSSSSCMGGTAPASAPVAVSAGPASTTRTPSPALAMSPGSQQSFLMAQMAEQERATTSATSAANTPRAGASAGIAAARTAPTTAHTAVPITTTPVNPADIRKHVKRSKSGGSEASFYPNSIFPGGTASSNGSSMPPAGSSGRRTPNSPMVNRYLHSSGEGGFAEPEDVELRNAFGHSRYPGSPSNLQYSGPSPSYLSSNAPAQSYLVPHHSLSHANGHGGVSGSNHSHGTTPTSSTPMAQTASTTTSVPTQGRSASRCSGVAPPMTYPDSRDELLDLRPAVRSNCLSTLPPTYSQYMYTNTAHNAAHPGTGAANNAPHTANQEPATVVNRSVVLKAPKFVRKLQEGMGAALLGMTGNAGRDDDGSSQGDASSASSRGARGVNGQSQGLAQMQGQNRGPQQSARDLRATAHANQHDNTVDAVREAGGLDQLLLPARALHRGGSLISDNHSAFSHGSMSSLRSNGKKSPKTRQ